MKRFLLIAGLLVFGFCLSWADDIDARKLPPPSKSSVDFVREVKPLLEARCLRCHGGAKPKGGFSLETRELALKGGENGPALVSGDSAKSKLIHHVAGLIEDLPMPPKGECTPLTLEQIGLI